MSSSEQGMHNLEVAEKSRTRFHSGFNKISLLAAMAASHKGCSRWKVWPDWAQGGCRLGKWWLAIGLVVVVAYWASDDLRHGSWWLRIRFCSVVNVDQALKSFLRVILHLIHLGLLIC